MLKIGSTYLLSRVKTDKGWTAFRDNVKMPEIAERTQTISLVPEFGLKAIFCQSQCWCQFHTKRKNFKLGFLSMLSTAGSFFSIAI